MNNFPRALTVVCISPIAKSVRACFLPFALNVTYLVVNLMMNRMNLLKNQTMMERALIATSETARAIVICIIFLVAWHCTGSGISLRVFHFYAEFSQSLIFFMVLPRMVFEGILCSDCARNSEA